MISPYMPIARSTSGIFATSYSQSVLERWGIRLATSLVGICTGLILSSALIDGFKMSLTSLIQATLIFWGVHFFVQVVALRTLIRQPSVALAGLLALAATVIALAIVNVIVGGLKVGGPSNYVLAALIIWITTAAGDTFATRKLRARRLDDRA